MNGILQYLVIGLVAIILGYVFRQIQLNALIKREGAKAERIILEAKEEAREIEVESKNTAIQIRERAEDEIKRRRNDLSNEDDRLQRRRTELDSRVDRLEKRDQNLNKRQSALDRKSNEVDSKQNEVLERLQQISTMTNDEAREVLLKEVEKEARSDMARIMRQIEAEAREEGEERARRLISLAIQRVASEHVSEITTSRVTLPSDEMKGRIIGRNGRNIRSFEQAAGVDVIVDDTPETVTISCSPFLEIIAEILEIQATGDYDKARSFQKKWGSMNATVKKAIQKLDGIPVDIYYGKK